MKALVESEDTKLVTERTVATAHVPEAGFLNKTEELTAECSECIGENNNRCYFEVNTVSEDCWLDSLPVEATSSEFTAIIHNYFKLHVYVITCMQSLQ